jgi:hypothetical protein
MIFGNAVASCDRFRGRRRGRQGPGRRITTQHYERKKPSNCPLAVCAGADRLDDVADGAA